MSCSAFSTDRRAADRGEQPASTPIERAIARILVVLMIGLTPGGSLAGDEFTSADQAVMLTEGTIDNDLAGQTTITSFVEDGQTLWAGGLDQPAANTLIFDLAGPNSTHYNIVGGDFTAHLNGTVRSMNPDDNHTIVFASPYGVFIGGQAQIDVGSLVAVGADLSNGMGDLSGIAGLPLTGDVINQGVITASQNVLLYGTNVVNAGEIYTEAGQLLMLGANALYFLDAETIAAGLLDPVDFVALLGDAQVINLDTISARDAALVGRRVVNHGHIQINDGTLLMLGAGAVHLREFDNPVTIELPHANNTLASSEGNQSYAVENHGTVDAGLGHVRMAAADALGWGIRQGTGTSEAPASIAAARVQIEGGENGRVQLSGTIDASDLRPGEVGGEIDVTGETIVLEGATILANGDAGGGTIQIGGEQQGGGELQRARGLVMDADSVVRADAVSNGDGGRVILFSEDLTHLAGEISAIGGVQGGDGGFIETSGLARFHIERAPDASAPNGQGGEWLIDPYNIHIVLDAAAPDCPTPGEACLNKAVEAILRPNFDSAGFDQILRTVAPDPMGIALPNNLDVDLLILALSLGTDVTLSTEAFDAASGDMAEAPGLFGDIVVDAAIDLPNAGVAPGTAATLTLLAAGSIDVNADITTGDGDLTETPNMVLSVVLRANDDSQRDPASDFGTDQLLGDVNIDADIRTGGGSFTASSISINQTAGRSLETDGGEVAMTAGAINRFGAPATLSRVSTDPDPAPSTTADPGIRIEGSIDTARPDDDPGTGGDISLLADGVAVQTSQSGNADLAIDTAELFVSGSLASGGGEISLSGSSRGASNAGSVELDGAVIDSAGGDVSISANHLDPEADLGAIDVRFVDATRGEGGEIDLTSVDISTDGGVLTIGDTSTQRISMDGTFDTTGGQFGENGLMSIVASDISGANSTEGRFGNGVIEIGGTGDATLMSAGITIDSRSVTFSNGTTPNMVSIEAVGASSAEISESDLGIGSEEDGAAFVRVGEVSIDGDYQVTFHENTRITASEIAITAADNPELLNAGEASDLTRLRFEGVGGADATLGTRLEADTIRISVGDGITASDGLAFVATDEMGTPTEFGLTRGTRGEYAGLQLRNQAGAERPEEITIEQDADLTIDEGVGTAATELFLGGQAGAGASGGVFDGAAIGANGMALTLTSQDGVVTVEDAAGLNDSTVVGAGELGRSRVRLNGGLLLAPDAMSTDPATDSVLLNLADAGDTLFDIESLTVSTPRSFTVTDATTASILRANELHFEAGRDTGLDEPTLDLSTMGGSLTVEAGVQLAATNLVSLHAGGVGFGDLVFEAPAGTPTRIASNGIELRAGGGLASNNLDPTTRSEIVGAAAVEYRDAMDMPFQSGAVARSFSYRQDEAIDAATHLPTLDDFGLTGGMTFGGGALPVEYSLRSDFGGIDLTTGGFDAIQVEDTILSLIGNGSAGPAISVADTFVWNGPAVTLGGTGNFTYSQALANAFSPAGTAAGPNKRVTLRAGLDSTGVLTFGGGVTVRAPHIELLAGDGAEGTVGSTVVTGGAMFDLSDGAADERIFVFQEDEVFALTDLPARTQFVGGVLPSTLAVRNDGGAIDLFDPDWTTLPLELTDPGNPGRLIFEAGTITMTANGGRDLMLTATTPSPMAGDALENLRLRLRVDLLGLDAIAGSEGNAGAVLAGPRSGDTAGARGPLSDSAFDDETLLIEGFDFDADKATITNLSSLSEDAANPALVDLAGGIGPSVISIRQDAAIVAEELPERFDIAGHLARSGTPDGEGGELATNLILASNFGDIAFNSDNVSGSNFVIGLEDLASDANVVFGASGGAYDFVNMAVFTTGDITLEDNADITSQNSIRLEAGVVVLEPTFGTEIDASNPMGRLIFAGAGTIDLVSNGLLLRAGPAVTVTNPDVDGDGEREEITDGLGEIDFAGLGSIGVGDPTRERTLEISQSADFDTQSVVMAMVGNGEWNRVDLNSVQGVLTVTDVDDLASVTQELALGRAGPLSSVVIEDTFTRTDPLSAAAGFEGEVRIETNDLLFRALGATELQLDAPNLRLVADNFATGLEGTRDFGRVLDDPDVLERSIVRVEQAGDFSATLLPRLDRYFQRGIDATTGLLSSFRRASLSRLDLELVTRGANFVFDDEIRDGTRDANLTIRTTETVAPTELTIDLQELRPGLANYEFESSDFDTSQFPAISLASFNPTGFDTIRVDPFTPTLPGTGVTRTDLIFETFGDQIWDADVVLEETLDTNGRDIRFAGDVYRDAGMAPTDVGLIVRTTGSVVFEGDLGTTTGGAVPAPAERLSKLWVLFDSDVVGAFPSVQFGRRTDDDGDGVAETPVESDQFVYVDEDIVFASTNLNEPDDPTDATDGTAIRDFMGDIESATTLDEIADALDTFEIGRTTNSPIATIGKSLGDLTFTSVAGGHFVMGSGERLAVGGNLLIDHPGNVVTLGDVAALGDAVIPGIDVNAAEIGLVRRSPGVTFIGDGASIQDGGSVIMANSIDFGTATLTEIGQGKQIRFGVPNPFDPTLAAFLAGFPVQANTSSNSLLSADSFRFTSGGVLDQVPSLFPTGASRSELTGAFGPRHEPIAEPRTRDLPPLARADRLRELDVEARELSPEVRLARLSGAAIIDDLGLVSRSSDIAVTDARLDARDAESAIALYESLFGAEGDRSERVRDVLQEALDRYLETTRARRVIGFELRRFVKNRPSTLLEAYTTLDQLDALFRYHRRLGLSPGEFRRIQAKWLEAIQPEGITLDELSEAIHPSRYVRGSDILDIFGR